MRFLLSINTVFPKTGNRVWYDDQRDVHRQIFDGDQMVDYAFMGDNPDAADNRWLREAFENQVPIIYFLGIAPGRYQAILPAFIGGWDRSSKRAHIAFGLPGQNSLTPPATEIERRYALQTVKQRLHQASFREAVIGAYRGRCAAVRFPRAHAARRRSHRRRSTRVAWSACGPQRHPALENPPRGLRRSSHRNRPGLSDCMFQSVCSFNMTVQCWRRSRG